MKIGKRSKEIYDFRPGDKISLGKNHVVLNKDALLVDLIKDHEYYIENYLPKTKKPKTKGTKNSDNIATTYASDSDVYKKSERFLTSNDKSVLKASEASSLFLGEEAILDQTVLEMEAQNATLERKRCDRIQNSAEESRAWKLMRKKTNMDGMTDGQTSTTSKEDDNSSSPVCLLFVHQTS